MKKLLSIIIVLSLILSSLLIITTSCGEEEKKEEKNNNSEKVNSITEGDIFAERAAIDDGLETVDFGGRKFRIVGHSGGEANNVNNTEINQGKLLTDANFYRTKTVEDRFNVDVEAVYVAGINEVADWVSKNVLSGADEFDLLVNHVLTSGGMVVKNLFLNWYDIPNVDFSKPWWAESNVSELTVDGKAILAISDFNSTAVSCTYALVFNKNLAASYDLGNLYEVVEDGRWTIDYLMDLIRDVYVDADGSGDRSEGDFYGMAQPTQSRLNQWLWAFDNPIMTKDDEGLPAVAIKTDKINSIVTKIYDLCYNTQGVFYDPTYSNYSSMFLEKKTIFGIDHIGALTGEEYRNFEDEYGILPLPKWDENQADYYSHSFGEHTVSAIPKTVKDTTFVGTIVEALAAESYKQVIPTFYEVALKTRYLRDNESKKMVDIIIKNRVFDFGYVYDNWKGFAYTLNDIIKSGNPNFESYYSRKYTGARYQYKSIVKIFEKI